MSGPVPQEVWELGHRHVGRRVLVYDTLASTNDRAAELAADPAEAGTVIMARAQTAGRGQYRRTWQAPAGASVLMSALVLPPPELRRPVLLTAWAAVAVCRAVRHFTDEPPRVKWPNDVLVCGKKVCGVLIEQGRGTVAGIGLNVNQSEDDWRAAGLPDAGSLAMFRRGPHLFDADDVARRLVRELDEGYGRLLGGGRGALEADWRGLLGLGGEVVVVRNDGTALGGRLVELGFDGLVLQGVDGVTRLEPEAVRQVGAVHL